MARTGYHEDSLVFLTRGAAQRVGRGRLSEWRRQHPQSVVFLGTEPEAFWRTPPGLAVTHRLQAHVLGFNYSSGERVLVGVWVARGLLPPAERSDSASLLR